MDDLGAPFPGLAIATIVSEFKHMLPSDNASPWSITCFSFSAKDYGNGPQGAALTSSGLWVVRSQVSSISISSVALAWILAHHCR